VGTFITNAFPSGGEARGGARRPGDARRSQIKEDYPAAERARGARGEGPTMHSSALQTLSLGHTRRAQANRKKEREREMGRPWRI
jgi:hypothetical protein